MKSVLLILVIGIFNFSVFGQANEPAVIVIEHFGIGDKSINALYIIDSSKKKEIKYNRDFSTVIYAKNKTLQNIYKPFVFISEQKTIDSSKRYEFGTFIFRFIFNNSQKLFLKNRKESKNLLLQIADELSDYNESEQAILKEIKSIIKRIS